VTFTAAGLTRKAMPAASIDAAEISLSLIDYVGCIVSQASYQHGAPYTCLVRATDFATLAFCGVASPAHRPSCQETQYVNRQAKQS